MQHILTTISTQSDIKKIMQPHSAQNMYVSTGNNSSANTRSNPQTGGGGIFRGPQQQPSSSVNAPRGGGVSGGATRHVHVQPMYSQAALHQNMVLQPYTQYNPRQQTFPTSHLQYAPTPMSYYQYQYVPTLQQQPPPPPQHTHPRSAAVSVNSNNNTLQAVQVQQQQQQSGNPGGGPGGTQSSQIQLLASTVQGPGGNIGQVGVGVAPMVGVSVMPQSVVPPQSVQVQVQQSSRRRHQHRLPIIDPTTKKNILEDLDKSNSNTENDFSNEQQTSATTAAAVLAEAPAIRIPQQDGSVGIIHQHNLSNSPSLGSNDIRTNAAPYSVSMEPITIQRLDAVGQTPIVSAMSDAPSVEILPTPQKVRSKKIPIVPPKNVSDSTSAYPSSSSTGTEDESKAKEQPTNENLINPKCIAVEVKESASILAVNTQITKANVVTSVGSLDADVVAPETKTSEFLSEEKILSTDEELIAKNIQESEVKSTEDRKPPEVLKHNPRHSEPTVFIDNAEENKSLDKSPSKKEQSDETDQSSLSSMALKEVVLPLEEKGQVVESPENAVEAEQEQTDTPEDTPSTKICSPENDLAELNITPCSFEKEKISSSFINYNEGQWSPSNPDGKKQYNREQLMQLREAKASRIQPEVKNVSILPQPNLMPSFIRNNNNKRVQSMVGMIGNRESSAGGYMGKQLSMSGVQGQSQGSGGRNSSMKGMMIHVNLSLNQDVKLNENENAWRPRLLNKASATENDSDLKATQEKDDLVRRVRGILNKLTPERFDTLVEEIIKLKIDTPDKMDEVIVLVFEKAIDEPNFSVSYARLCHRLITEVKARDERMESGTKSNLAHFRNALLDKTEREFTQNVSQSTAKEKKLQPIVDKIRKCSDPNEKAELEAFLEEEERKIRRRSGGTVRFIGELFKISMLTGKIIYSCIDTLLNPHSEDMLECLCKLLTTVGAKFEQTPVNSKDPGRCYSLEKSITKMQAIAAKTDKDGAKVSSRVRFMLQDVIDLRKNKWQTSRNEAPKTMGQIEKEAKNEQLTAQYFGNISGNSTPIGSSQSGGGSNKRDDRNMNSRYGNETRSGSNYGGSHSQRGHHQQQNTAGGGGGGGGVVGGSGGASNGGNNDDNTWHVQTSKGSRSQAVDSNKLEGLSKLSDQNLETKKMGGLTQFIWNNNTRQSSSASVAPSSTPSNPFAVLSSLIDKNSSSSDRDNRDRDHHHDHRGPRNKGSYNKGSMERDRYDRGINSRTGSSQGSRESSSSRQQGGGRSLMNSAVQKSASHSKYTQQQPPTSVRHNTSSKVQSNSSSNAERGIYRGGNNEQALGLVATPATTFAQQSNRTDVSAPPAVFQEASDADLKLAKSVVSEMIELADAAKTVTPAVVACMNRIPEDRRCGFLYYILTDYLHLANVGKQSRRYLGITVSQLIQQNYISVEHFTLAYNEFSEYANDFIVDIPELWLYILQFAGPLIVKKLLTVSDLWNKNLKDNCPSSVAKKFLKTYLVYCTQEVGPNFTRNMWTKFTLHWSDFMPENEVNDFIKSNRLEYVENESISPVIEQRGGESSEKHVKNVIDHIEHLLKEGTTADCIIDYSNGNIMVVDKLFIRSLTESLSNFSILYKENSYKLDTETFQKFCIPVLQRYIDSNEDHQLECLYAVQLLVHSLEHPRGLLSELFGELYDAYVIQKESLCKWRDSKDQSAGKGVAVKSLNPFFNSLFNDEAN